ncbi:AfsR/SARP family transcriptional regulator [Amycolatopsis sp.]|uniref:AfsR/SARP family transcriptional regulator n=1 Tax=Amycolatopsis sp. TaxID=37632 RepID=UPI002BE58957|nr:BTAD domain-containing putative transcriptional regulator [Amycolatopsis sp.]HVV10909.1 BTAD domain-containing putative transcriptional regulator [Amycolatopsis sp.]
MNVEGSTHREDATMAKFGVLGPLRVEGGSLRLRGERQRSLLAMLLFRANEDVPVPQLVDALWIGEPPKSYVSNLHTYVQRLRQRLDSAWIDHTENGYRLRVSERDLDLLVFRAEAAEGRRAAAQGDHARAAKHLRRALEQWRGQPLTDLHVPPLDTEASRLEAEHLGVLEDCIDAELAIGKHNELIGELTALAAENPLRERTAAQLMIALQRAGRQADALSVYRRTRARLVEELGVEPSGVLRRAQSTVLRGEELTPGTPWPICQLPADLLDFSGRATEIDKLAGLLSEPGMPLVVLSGEPGAGKSTLATKVAHRLRTEFPDGQLFIPLTGTSAPRDVGALLNDVLRALDVSGSAIPDDVQARAAAYRGLLTDRRVLVVLDDAADPAQVRALLPGTPGCAVLVTSRRRLSALEGARRVELGPMSDDEASLLLARIAGPERVAGERAAAARITAACGNLPLALRIAAIRLAMRPYLPLAALASRLEDVLRKLDELTVSDLQLRGSIALSYQALSQDAQRGLRAIARCRNENQPGWAVTALIDRPDADRTVEELVEAGLLWPYGADATGEPRYRLHDMVRVFATEVGVTEDSRDERVASVRRLVDAAINLSDAAARALPGGALLPSVELPPQPLPAEFVAKLLADPQVWFETERTNLLSAVASVTALGWRREAELIMDRLAVYLRLRCNHADLRTGYDILGA